MKNRLLTFATLLSFLVGIVALRAQSPAAASGGKVAVINMQAAIANTAEGKKALGDLQKKFTPRRQDLEHQQQEIAALQDQLQRQATTLSDDEQRRLTRELDDKQRIFKRAQEDFQAEGQQEQADIGQRIGQKMVKLLDDYAQKNGFDIVMDATPQTLPIYYIAPQLDLTETMIKLYDAANPVAAEAAPAAKPPEKPAAKPKP
jgi:Skp family chaperone for outer membrane proteins